MTEGKELQIFKSISPIDPAAIAAAEAVKARIQSAYVMAYQKPRGYDDARIAILDACRRPGFAAKVEYKKPIGKTFARGPSIRFAELALRIWGNVLAESQVIHEDEKARRIRVSVLDLETNSTFSKDIQISKTVERRNKQGRDVLGERVNTNGEVVYIVRATDDELLTKEAAMISKAFRNEGLRLVPSDIVDEAIEVARKTMKDQFAKDPKEAKKKVLDAFAEIGIKPKDIEKYLLHPLDTVSPNELETLRGMYRAIRDGEATWAEYTNPPDKDENGEALKDLETKIRGKKTDETKLCPNKNDKPVPIADCDMCTVRQGCPAWA